MSASISAPGLSPGPSPFELLHPAGTVETWALCGGEATGVLSPVHPPAERTASEVELLMLAPSRAEGRDRSWIARAVERAGAVRAEGLVVALRPSRALTAALLGSGLTVETRLAHVPDIERSRFVFPAGGHEARFAVRSLVSLSRPKRLAVALMARGAFSTRMPVSVVFRAPGAAQLGSWLAELGSPVPRCTAVLARSWRHGGASVVMRFAESIEPDMVVKVGKAGAAEAEGLRVVAPGALRANLAVPRLLSVTELDSRPVVAETPVHGRPASLVVDGSATRATRSITALADRLREWEQASVVRRPLAAPDIERLLTVPAGRLADALPDSYVTALSRAAESLAGTEVPLVAAHRDTTAANVMLGSGSRIGLIDWEEATPETLPLGDLAYAIVDFAAASDGYRDRLAAYRQCFEPGGRFTAFAAGLIDQGASALGLSETVLGLALQACWLLHADNERTETGADGPFLSILRRAAADWAR